MPSGKSRKRLVTTAGAVLALLCWLWLDEQLATLPGWVDFILLWPVRFVTWIGQQAGLNPDQRVLLAILVGLPALIGYWAAGYNQLVRLLQRLTVSREENR